MVSDRVKEHNRASYRWFQTNNKVFTLCVLITGGTYSSLAFTSSRLFGLRVLNSGLSQADMTSFAGIRLVCNVILEV